MIKQKKYKKQLGIRVVLDIVVNHMCDPGTRYTNPPSASAHSACASELSQKYWSGQPGGSGAQGELEFGEDFFPPFRSTTRGQIAVM